MKVNTFNDVEVAYSKIQDYEHRAREVTDKLFKRYEDRLSHNGELPRGCWDYKAEGAKELWNRAVKFDKLSCEEVVKRYDELKKISQELHYANKEAFAKARVAYRDNVVKPLHDEYKDMTEQLKLKPGQEVTEELKRTFAKRNELARKLGREQKLLHRVYGLTVE